MALISWKSFSNLNNFFEDEDWLLSALPHLDVSKPAMDIYETDKDIVAEVSVPGFDPKK